MWHHLRAIVLLPGMAAVVIPALILFLAGVDTFDLWQFPGLQITLVILGILFVLLGLGLMIATIWLFATVGQGTLAPWHPTRHLVLQGIYRHVRNPMISGVFSILLGEAVFTASLPLSCWFALFVIGNLLYIPLVEEPGLVKRFGNQYLTYRQHVPRWIPRLTAWKGSV